MPNPIKFEIKNTNERFSSERLPPSSFFIILKWFMAIENLILRFTSKIPIFLEPLLSELFSDVSLKPGCYERTITLLFRV